MQESRFERFAPLAGVAFVILVMASFMTFGDGPPSPDEPVEESARFWAENDTKLAVSVVLEGLGAIALVFFGAILAQALRPADGGPVGLWLLPLIGASIAATGFLVDASLTLALTSTAEDISPAGVEALSAFYENDFIPMAGGIAIIALSSGLLILRSGVLPKWLGWVAIALFVIGVTPLGFVGFIGMGIWILVVSVMLFMRGGRRGGEPAPAAMAS